MRLSIRPGVRRLFFTIALLVAGLPAAAALQQYEEIRLLMGTAVRVTLEGPNLSSLHLAADDAFRTMHRLADEMNHYDAASTVSAINVNAGVKPVVVSSDLMAVLAQAQRLAALTDGAFDITVGALSGWRFDPERPLLPAPETVRAQLPLVNYRRLYLDHAGGTAFLARRGMRIDLGGIAKLYIMQKGMTALKRQGIQHALVDAGGDIAVRGTFRGRPWRIAIRDPRAPGHFLEVLHLTQGCVVSSGDYERGFVHDGRRYHHILDPRTGYPAQGPRQVTLVASSLEQVNGLSAAVMVLGSARGRRLIERTPGLMGIIIDEQAVWMSPSLRSAIAGR